MSFTVFLGNLPTWVTADDIKAWLTADGLVADSVKVIRNPETQESKGFAFIDAPNTEEMQSIIRRFDRAPLEDRLLRANPAQPPKGRSDRPGDRPDRPGGRPMGAEGGPPQGDRPPRRREASGPSSGGSGPSGGSSSGSGPSGGGAGRPPRSGGNGAAKKSSGPPSAFAEELAKAL